MGDTTAWLKKRRDIVPGTTLCRKESPLSFLLPSHSSYHSQPSHIGPRRFHPQSQITSHVFLLLDPDLLLNRYSSLIHLHASALMRASCSLHAASLQVYHPDPSFFYSSVFHHTFTCSDNSDASRTQAPSRRRLRRSLATSSCTSSSLVYGFPS